MDNPMDLPAAQAAKLVKRQIPEADEDGNPTGKMKPVDVDADEVFACRVRDTVLTVITTDGVRLTGAVPVKAADKKVEK